MKFKHFLIVLFILPIYLIAQTEDKEVPRFLLGVEASSIFSDLDYNYSKFNYFSYGVNVEKPIGQFSIGTALIKQRFGQNTFYEYADIVKLPENANSREEYGYKYTAYQLNFLTVPFRLQYRLPCNCVYVQAGVLATYKQLKKNNEQSGGDEVVFLYSEPTDDIYAPTDIASKSLGYELAFGMNFHLAPSLKMFSRFYYMQYGFQDDSIKQFKDIGNSFFGVSLGMQYAVF